MTPSHFHAYVRRWPRSGRNRSPTLRRFSIESMGRVPFVEGNREHEAGSMVRPRRPGPLEGRRQPPSEREFAVRGTLAGRNICRLILSKGRYPPLDCWGGAGGVHIPRTIGTRFAIGPHQAPFIPPVLSGVEQTCSDLESAVGSGVKAPDLRLRLACSAIRSPLPPSRCLLSADPTAQR